MIKGVSERKTGRRKEGKRQERDISPAAPPRKQRNSRPCVGKPIVQSITKFNFRGTVYI